MRHQQHPGDEHRQEDEVAVVAGLAVQIPIRERRDHAGNHRRQRRERQREAIDQELDGDAAFGRGRPGAVRQQLGAGCADAVHRQRSEERGARGRHRDRGERPGPSLGQRTVEERRPTEDREQDRGRSHADQHQDGEREVRHHGEGAIDTGARKPRLP
jgi:hypothetical protein